MMRTKKIVLALATLASSFAALVACSSSSTSVDTPAQAPDADASIEANAADTSVIDANCLKPKTLPGTGETCVGFGAGTPCDQACGLPAYGYVCFGGGPPSFIGCVQASTTSGLGDTYCCPKNDCVAQPDQDAMCMTAGKTHRFQCPPDAMGNAVAAPTGCVASGSGTTALEKFYCCP